MRRFADLLDRLILTPSRTTKLRLIGDYFAHTPDPDRGWALAALAGTLDLRLIRSSYIYIGGGISYYLQCFSTP